MPGRGKTRRCGPALACGSALVRNPPDFLPAVVAHKQGTVGHLQQADGPAQLRATLRGWLEAKDARVKAGHDWRNKVPMLTLIKAERDALLNLETVARRLEGM